MVDHSAMVYMQLHKHHGKTRVSVQQAEKIDVIAARTYSDDIDICRGALSAPNPRFRPGQRDDAAAPQVFNSVIPVS